MSRPIGKELEGRRHFDTRHEIKGAILPFVACTIMDEHGAGKELSLLAQREMISEAHFHLLAFIRLQEEGTRDRRLGQLIKLFMIRCANNLYQHLIRCAEGLIAMDNLRR